MVTVVTEDNRPKYREQLAQMHRDRKKVFVDRWKWDVPVVDGEYEIDQFDTPSAVYLLSLCPHTRRHLSSVRLLPTTEPHILGSLFPELCEGDVPSGDDVWEITRSVETPDVPKKIARESSDRITVALVEFALLFGISTYTCTVHMGMVSMILSEGWECEPLGLPKTINGELLTALKMKISPATLQLFRQRAGTRRPILEWETSAAAA